MPNRKFTTARAVAFWLGLTLHLTLGAALYQQSIDLNAFRIGDDKHLVHILRASVKP